MAELVLAELLELQRYGQENGWNYVDLRGTEEALARMIELATKRDETISALEAANQRIHYFADTLARHHTELCRQLGLDPDEAGDEEVFAALEAVCQEPSVETKVSAFAKKFAHVFSYEDHINFLSLFEEHHKTISCLRREIKRLAANTAQKQLETAAGTGDEHG